MKKNKLVTLAAITGLLLGAEYSLDAFPRADTRDNPNFNWDPNTLADTTPEQAAYFFEDTHGQEYDTGAQVKKLQKQNKALQRRAQDMQTQQEELKNQVKALQEGKKSK